MKVSCTTVRHWLQFILISIISAGVSAQEIQFRDVQNKGDRLSGVVLPVLPRDAEITILALRADAWSVDDTKRLVLTTDIVISIGTYTFQAEKASVWINRMPTDRGVVSQIAVYMPTSTRTGGRAALGAEGKDLLIVGSTRGGINMDVALLTPKKPANQGAFIQQSESRLAGYIQGLQIGETKLSTRPEVIASPLPVEEDKTLISQVPVQQTKQPWLRSKSGIMSITADHVELETGDIENTVTIVGNVVLELRSTSGIDDMQMTADRAVIFTDPGSIRDMASGKIESQDIRGIYLEGNVLVDSNHGEYLVRSPQAYYDFTTDNAMLVEAVLRTYAMQGKVPLFVRAKEMRQVAVDQWTAKGVQVSTSSFATPDLAIGSSELTLTEQPDGNMFIESSHNTLRMGGLPVFYWPHYSGEANDIPLHKVKFGYKKTFGSFLETEWDLFTLLGVQQPKGLKADLRLDGYKARGAGVGLDIGYAFGNHDGDLDLYFLSDAGMQKTSSGVEMDVPDHQRGYMLWENQTTLSDHWSLQTQLSYISDPTLMSVWRQSEYKNRREYETSIYAKYQKENWAFTAFASHDLNKFISISWLLASRQYAVEKAPELGLFRYADDIFNGAVTWSSETRITRERMRFQDGTPVSNGLKRRAFPMPGGGFLGNNQPFTDLFAARGLTEGFKNRLTTRHEFTAPFSVGAFKFAPFASMQADVRIGDDDAAANEKDTKWFSTVGLRASTQVQRIYNDIDNGILDLHRLRHVIEPYMTLWYGSGSVDPMSIEQYNALVDNVSTGTAAWLGVKNTLQTWRGGPGRWYEVDWLTVDVSLLAAGSDSTRRYDVPQFFSWRPEYSSLEDSVMANSIWQISDGVALLGNGTWLTDNGRMVRGSVGAELDHGKDVRTFVEYRELANSDDQFLAVDLQYKLSRRYSFNASPTWNMKEDDLQALRLNLTRHYPDFDLVGQVTHNSIKDETQYGLAFRLLKF